MTTRTLHLPAFEGFGLFLNREQLTNQERVDSPPSWDDAIAIAKDARVPRDFRILAIHRLLDLAIRARGDEALELWTRIHGSAKRILASGDAPRALQRFALNVPRGVLRDWAEAELRKTQPDSNVEVEQQARAA